MECISSASAAEFAKSIAIDLARNAARMRKTTLAEIGSQDQVLTFRQVENDQLHLHITVHSGTLAASIKEFKKGNVSQDQK